MFPVSASPSPPQPDPHSVMTPPERQSKGSMLAKGRRLEVTGVVVVAVIILIITLARYWHNFAWSAR
jgi:hypothetical protein